MKNSNGSLDVVKDFFKAINAGDMDTAKSLMAEEHIYTGPMFSTNNREDYMNKLMEMGMEFAVESHDLIGADSFVTHVSTLKVLSPVQASIPCCEVFEVVEGKIIRQRFFFDTALFPKS